MSLFYTITLTATVLPENADNKNVTSLSSDTTVVKVVDGKLIPVTHGTATITVTTEDGNKTDTSKVTVNFWARLASKPRKHGL